MGVKRGSPENLLAISERRKKVAPLYLAHLTQAEIGRQLDVDQRTISNDIKAIKAEYRAERIELIDREAAELDAMEKEAALEFARSREREWMAERREIKKLRAALLGLNAPTKQIHQGDEEGGPVQVAIKSEADALDAKVREVVARALLPVNVSGGEDADG